jgi:hypothetical protein
MSTQLREAIATAGPETVEHVKAMLATIAGDAVDLGAPNAASIYRALIDDLTTPAQTWRAELVATVLEADEADPNLVDAIVQDFVGAAHDNPSNVLPFALARELGAAAVLGRRTAQSFTADLDNPDFDDCA